MARPHSISPEKIKQIKSLIGSASYRIIASQTGVSYGTVQKVGSGNYKQGCYKKDKLICPITGWSIYK